jgi:DNA polymerase iota
MAPPPLTPRVVLAFDLDCFYASVMLLLPEYSHLTSKPFGVFQKHIVVTTNYVARAHGVPKMSTVTSARAACPLLTLVDGSNLAPFRRAAARVRGCVRKHLPPGTAVEYAGLDELFVDITAIVARRKPQNSRFHGHVFADGEDDEPPSVAATRALQEGSAFAAELRAAVLSETGLKMCGGIADSKLGAKIAAGVHKPNDQTTFISSDAIARYLADRPPSAIPGFGMSYSARLSKIAPEIRSVTALREVYPPGREAVLAAALDVPRATAEWIVRAAAGQDTRTVKQSGAPQVVTCEDAMRVCCTMDNVQLRLRDMACSLIARLAEDADEHGTRFPSTLNVKFRFKGSGPKSTWRAVPMPASVLASSRKEESVDDLLRAALEVLEKNGVSSTPGTPPFSMSLLGLGAANFSTSCSSRNRLCDISQFVTPAVQPSKLQTQNEKLERLASAHAAPYSLATQSTPSLQPLALALSTIQRSNSVTVIAQIPDVQELTLVVCPVCDVALPPETNNEQLNNHVDKCLARASGTTGPSRKKLRMTNQKTRRVDTFFTQR